MSKITLKLLQTPSILLDGVPVIFPIKKAEALIFCLALKKTFTRDWIAALLWDIDDAAVGKKNLRHTLYSIKKVLNLDLLVSPQRHLLALNPDIECEIDYDIFMNTHDISLSEGELLQSFSLKNADAFESWLDMERKEFKYFYLHLLYERMVCEAAKDVSAAEALFVKYTKQEPLDERVYQLMMECYQQNGLYYKGIKVYENISRLLNEELCISPCTRLKQLHRQLLNTWVESAGDEAEQSQLNVTGRREEIMYMMKSYREFLMGTPTALLIQGDNGVGKTFLANSFLEIIGKNSCIVLKASCFREEHDFIMQPWDAIMLQLDQQITGRGIDIPSCYLGYIEVMFPLFGGMLPSAQMPEDIITSYSYRSVRNSLIKIFSAVGSEVPIILFFDNIHFMGSLSLELLSLIIKECGSNIMCICTCLDVQPAFVQKLINSLAREKLIAKMMLQPFTKQDITDIITERLGHDALSEQTISQIYQESEGNGFFLDLLLEYLKRDTEGSSYIPANTHDMLLARLDALTPDARQMLDTISTSPESIGLEVIENIFNRGTIEIIELTNELKQHGLIQEFVQGGQIHFRFRHAKMRDFVHSQLSASKHRLLHARVADYYEQTDTLLRTNNWYQRLIYDNTQAGRNAKALRYKILSLADYSIYNYELYPILQSHKSDDPEVPYQLSKYFDELSQELIHLYNYQPNAVDFDELDISLCMVVSKYCISQGYYKKGLEAVGRCLNHTDFLEQNPRIKIACLRQLTFYGIQVWNKELMKENIEKNLVLAKKNRLDTDYAIETRLYGLYFMMCGQYDESRKQLEKAIALFGASALDEPNYALNIAACYNYLGEAERKNGNMEASLNYYDRALEIYDSHNFLQKPKNPTFYVNKAQALLALGQKAQAADLLFTANELYASSNILMGRAITKSYCSLIRAEDGYIEDARTLLREAEQAAQALGSPVSMGIVERAKAVLIKHFYDDFNDIIPEGFDLCAKKCRLHLSGLAGAYESDAPFELLGVD